MKVLICILAFAATVHGGLLPHIEAPPPFHSSHSSSETKVIKLIQETASLPHATLPTPPLKILKVLHQSPANIVDLPVPAAGSSKIIKVVHQAVSRAAPPPVAPPRIVKVIHQSAPLAAAVAAPTKVLRVIHEYAPRHYQPAPESQSTKLLKIIKQQTVTPHPAPVAQNLRVYKVFRQLGGEGGALSSLSSLHGAGQTYASNYGHGHVTPTSIVKVIKVLDKPAHYPSSSRW